MAPDVYYRPDRLEDALAVLSQGTATVAAGCTDLFPATEAPQLPGPVLDITGIDDLCGVSRDETGWRIGAATPWSSVVTADLPPAFDMLKLAAREVGSAQIQNAGTVGGNLCNASPAADGVPPLLALDASVELSSAAGHRVLALSDFLCGPRQTALAPGELLTAVLIPEASTTGVSGFCKLGARKYLVISIAMVAARLDIQAGKIAAAALSVGACSPVATRLPSVEAALVGHAPDEAAAHVSPESVAAALAPIGDIRADAAYRVGAATELLRRVLVQISDGEAAR